MAYGKMMKRIIMQNRVERPSGWWGAPNYIIEVRQSTEICDVSKEKILPPGTFIYVLGNEYMCKSYETKEIHTQLMIAKMIGCPVIHL